jgi:hypothetical protein
MKKFLLALVVLSGVALSSFAQKTGNVDKFNVGVDIGVPLGDASTIYDLGLGVSLKYELPVAKQLAFTASAGYTVFFVKNNLTSLGAQSTFGYVPLKAGLKYYINNNFYLEGQAGATFSTESGGGTAFAWSPGIGYNLGGGFDMSARYESWNHNGTLNQAALRFAYSF